MKTVLFLTKMNLEDYFQIWPFEGYFIRSQEHESSRVNEVENYISSERSKLPR